MTKNIKIYKKQEIIKKKNIKYILKKIILKSIIQSNDIQNYKKIFANFLFKNLKSNAQNRITKNICFLTSKNKATSRKIGLSRYSIKKSALNNKLQNINVYSK